MIVNITRIIQFRLPNFEVGLHKKKKKFKKNKQNNSFESAGKGLSNASRTKIWG